jgi:hypothetical protein
VVKGEDTVKNSELKDPMAVAEARQLAALMANVDNNGNSSADLPLLGLAAAAARHRLLLSFLFLPFFFRRVRPLRGQRGPAVFQPTRNADRIARQRLWPVDRLLPSGALLPCRPPFFYATSLPWPPQPGSRDPG